MSEQSDDKIAKLIQFAQKAKDRPEVKQLIEKLRNKDGKPRPQVDMAFKALDKLMKNHGNDRSYHGNNDSNNSGADVPHPEYHYNNEFKPQHHEYPQQDPYNGYHPAQQHGYYPGNEGQGNFQPQQFPTPYAPHAGSSNHAG